MTGMFSEDRTDFIASFHEYDLLIIDDLGVERSTVAHARIYDRILERCAPILFAGKNFREENAAATKTAAKEIVFPN